MNITGNNVMAVHEDNRTVEQNENVILSYESHDVISIIGDTDFETQATNEMWEGDGSSDTPYLIQGYNINNDTHLSIEIIDVSLYFEIRDCLISSAPAISAGGIEISNVTHGSIENCLIANKNTGLGISDSVGFSVVNCTMNNNAAGATVGDSNYTSFTECYFTNTTTGSGFYQDNSHWTSITDSYINNNGDYGVESYWSDYFAFTGNEVTGNGYAGLLLENSHYGDYQFNTVFDNSEEGFWVNSCHHLIITENTMNNNGRDGLHLTGSDYGYFAHNVIYNNTLEGIFYDSGDHSEIVGNTIYDNGWTNLEMGAVASGISFDTIYNCSVIENEVFNNTAHGILVYRAENSSIHENTVWGNYGLEGECGIYVDYSDWCNITSNLVYNNTENGIFMVDSDDCIVTHNIVYDNTLYGINLENCNRTLIYYNDIGWNLESARDFNDPDQLNHWDNGVIGNWWSDYDGSGPYNITGVPDSQDMHPAKSLELGPVSNAQYELGSAGNALIITAQALNPWYYEVLADTQIVETHEWNGGMITPSIDGLDVGVYNLTIRAYHVSGHYLNSSSTVTVVDTTPPGWVVVPTNQTLAYNEALSYQLEVTDLSAIDEWIVNDTVHFSIVDGLLTNSTTLDVGYYYLNITVVDAYGNARTALIRIHVAPISAPPADLTGLILAIGGGAAILALVVIVIIIKKKQV
jgi:parallel beta-helix repeat protein